MERWTEQQQNEAAVIAVRHFVVVRCRICGELGPGPESPGSSYAQMGAARSFASNLYLQDMFRSKEDIAQAVSELVQCWQANTCRCMAKSVS